MTRPPNAHEGNRACEAIVILAVVILAFVFGIGWFAVKVMVRP